MKRFVLIEFNEKNRLQVVSRHLNTLIVQSSRIQTTNQIGNWLALNTNIWSQNVVANLRKVKPMNVKSSDGTLKSMSKLNCYRNRNYFDSTFMHQTWQIRSKLSHIDNDFRYCFNSRTLPSSFPRVLFYGILHGQHWVIRFAILILRHHHFLYSVNNFNRNWVEVSNPKRYGEKLTLFVSIKNSNACFSRLRVVK